MPDFAQQANAQSLVCVQLEHAEAVRNIDAILAVEGIDVFFIGPSDLSQSMGFPGNPKAPAVAEAIDETLAKIVAAGRTPGMPATSENLSDVIGKGCRYIYTHLPRLIGAGSAAFLKAGVSQVSQPARGTVLNEDCLLHCTGRGAASADREALRPSLKARSRVSGPAVSASRSGTIHKT